MPRLRPDVINYALLTTGVIILVALLLLPYTLDMSLLDILSSIVRPLVMVLLLLVTLVVIGASAVGLVAPQYSRPVAWVNFGCGLLLLVFALIDISAAVSAMEINPNVDEQNIGLGLLFVILGGLVLVGQVFLPRPEPGEFGLVGHLTGGESLGVRPDSQAYIPPIPDRRRIERPPARPEPQPTSIQAPRRTTNAWLVDMHTQQRYQLYAGETRIGRSQQRSDIALRDSTVSREQTVIHYSNQRFYITDIGAKQPIYVNDHRIGQQQLLNPGDYIRLGGTTLRFIVG